MPFRTVRPLAPTFPIVSAVLATVLATGCSRSGDAPPTGANADGPAQPAYPEPAGALPPTTGSSGDPSATAGAVPAATATSEQAIGVGGGTAAPNANTATPTANAAPSASVGTGAAQVRLAQATLEPRSGSRTSGTIALREAEGRLTATITVTGLQPNAEHGFHVHEKGDCSAPDAASAGGHFDSGNQRHGRPGGTEYHAGDLPNLKADAQGVAKLEMPIPGLSLAGGPNLIVGRSFVVHRDPDDYRSQPAGNSGPRIACGVIRAVDAVTPR